MAFKRDIKDIVCEYCINHLPNDAWYENQFDFVEDEMLRKRIIEEFKAVRFAYKLYEGIEAKGENLVFEIRHQIFVYASLYEAIIDYVLKNYYNDTKIFDDLIHFKGFNRISIPNDKLQKLKKELTHNGDDIIPFCAVRKAKDYTKVRFSEKCNAAEQLGIISKINNSSGDVVDLPKDIVKVYEYRNAIHLIAEQRKGVEYELDMGRIAYRRMQPFVSQVRQKLKDDKKGIFKITV